MKYYNTKTKETIWENYIITDDGTFFIDNLTEKKRKEFNLIPIQEIKVSEQPKDKYQYIKTTTEETEEAYIINEEIADVDIEMAKSIKLEELKEWAKEQTNRCKINLKGFGVIDGGYNYIANAEALINTYEINPQKVFRMFDDSFKEVTIEQLHSIKKAIEYAGVLIHGIKWNIENTISQATSITTLKAIQFPDTIDVDLTKVE
ncbi:hypothetical protein [Campylobacter sp. RM16192]|uniref:hypothetical protein n=1 Tax=Campylobacter sp. RM16192 TaxID=1660080 RepID=UPI001451BEEF|nr:hypothetical protein [Campylobacter sp. RM16192]QCD52510.1 putative protein (DUF4376 domain) [Campylobacter sp. RM16192]